MQTLETVKEVKTNTPKTRLDWALHHGAANHEMVLLKEDTLDKDGKPNGKKPFFESWPSRTTCDPVTIKALWGEHPNSNVGIRTGRRSDRKILVVWDIDVRPAKDGEPAIDGREAMAELEAKGLKLPPSYMVRTAGGGWQLYFWASRLLRSRTRLYPGIDVKCHGGQVVAAGSVVNGRQYVEHLNLPIADLPEWAEHAIGVADETPKAAVNNHVVPPEIDQEHAKKRAIWYLENEAEPAIEGRGGDNQTLIVAEKVKDHGVPQHVATELMLKIYNPRCCPPWSDDELATKVANAYRYGQKPIGCAAPEVEFPPLPQAEPLAMLDPKAPWLEEMNENNFIVNHGREILVYRPSFDPGLKRQKYDKHPFASLLQLYQNDRVPVVQDSGRVIRKNKGAAWLDHPLRRQYLKGAAYAPGQILPDGMLNLDRGFGIEPKKGAWPLMHAHIRNVICSGDETTYRYVIGWLARAVQYRDDRGLVAMVLRGDRGVGKGIVGNTFLRIFGQHGVYISNSEQLTGKFNGHLEDASFLFGDECFFAHDKKHLSTLKALVTEPAIAIEEKFQSVRMARNCIHLLLATNEEFAVPAGRDERRFCVLDVSDAHKQDRNYFTPLRHELGLDADTDGTGAGAAAMLYDLLRYDASSFDITNVPKTTALLEQKLHGMSGTQKWLFDCLQQGTIPGASAECDTWDTASLSVMKQNAYAAYRSYSKLSREYRPEEAAPWMKDLKKMLGHCVGDARPWAKEGSRPRLLIFEPLDRCRVAFEAWIGHPVAWPSDTEITADECPDIFQG